VTAADDRILAAIDAARGTFHCVECWSSDVGADRLADGSWRPWIAHWKTPDGECPCIAGNYEAAARVSVDLLDAIEQAGAPLAQYGEDPPWHRRQKVTA
jgi:hypothetical protein